MDSLIGAAARALSAGDPLSALKWISLRADPPALALRGIALAQLGELTRARALLRSAAKAFGPREALARARCIVAEAEIALAIRDLTWSPRALGVALTTLDTLGDSVNALHGRLIGVRRLVLLGRIEQAKRALPSLTPHGINPTLDASAALLEAELWLRQCRAEPAAAALKRARDAARLSRVAALRAEVEVVARALTQAAARERRRGRDRALQLAQVELLLQSGDLVVNALSRSVQYGELQVKLARRPVLFALAQELAAEAPQSVSREQLLARVFGVKRPNESHRARLRVQISRLRSALRSMARLEATTAGFALHAAPIRPSGAARGVCVLLPPMDGEQAALVGLLSDGQAWSTSALALALGDTQRSVQRALAELQSAGRVRSTGRGRAQRWLAPPLTQVALESGPRERFTTVLLLPTNLGAG